MGDERQLNVPARIITCHSMATKFVCHAPTGTYVYALKVKVGMQGGGHEVVDFNCMCHDGTDAEPKQETACHAMGPGGVAIFPAEYSIQSNIAILYAQGKLGQNISLADDA